MKAFKIFIIILFFAFSLSAKNVYVSDAGSDSNSGLSPSLAMATFDNALDLCTIGDNIILINYQENTAAADCPYDITGISLYGAGEVIFELEDMTNVPASIFTINQATSGNMVIKNITIQNSDLTPTFQKPVFARTGTLAAAYKIEFIDNTFINCGTVSYTNDRLIYFDAAGPTVIFKGNYCYDSFISCYVGSTSFATYGRFEVYNNVFEGSSTSKYIGGSSAESPNGCELRDNVFDTGIIGFTNHSSINKDCTLVYEDHNMFYNIASAHNLLLQGSYQTIDATSVTGVDPKVYSGHTSNASPIWSTYPSSETYEKYIGITQSKTGMTIN